MPKSLLLLLVFVPLIGISQSARKTNKLLKQEFALQQQNHVAAIRIYDSLDAVCERVGGDFKESWIFFSNKLSEASRAKNNALSLYRTAELLEITRSLTITYQTVDTIAVPNEMKILEDISSKYEGLDRLNKHFVESELADLSVREQNELLVANISEIKQAIVDAQTINAKLITAIPQLNEDIDWLKTEGNKLSGVTQKLKISITYLEEQKQLARNNYAQKGPTGFNVNYERLFPEVFPNQFSNSETYDAVTTDFGEFEPDDVPVKAMSTPEPVQEPEIYTVVDEYPEFPGGMAKLKEFIKANLKYPETALELGLEGKCYLQFVVSAQGNISNVKVLRGVADCPECDKEAIRMTKSMPKWTPGKINGKAVNSWFNLPVSFKLP